MALIAMRPRDPRYAAIPLAGADATMDATVKCAVLCWPVIDPLGRYHKVQREFTEGKKDAGDTVRSHDLFWGSEAAMDEGSPTRALERGEAAVMPPMLYVQGTIDPAHPREHLDRFVAAYRKAGGRLELHMAEGMSQNFMNDNPAAAATGAAIAAIIEFLHRETARR